MVFPGALMLNTRAAAHSQWFIVDDPGCSVFREEH
jgi:hypothetical protein